MECLAHSHREDPLEGTWKRTTFKKGWACNLCVVREEKIASIEMELERLKAKVVVEKKERDVKRMLKP